MKGTILIVEDDADLRKALMIRLKAEGYQVVSAADGASGMTMAQSRPPDLILLDLGLPAGDGFAVLERLRRLPKLARIPVVVLSGRDRAANEARALEAGAVAFLSKPPENDALLKVIGEQIGSKGGVPPAGRPPAPAASATKPAARRRILLVEDDADTRAAVRIRLGAAGFDVVEAEDASSALQAAARDKPDLILLDLGLPAGDGFGLLDRLRSRPDLSVAPVIVLSARDPVANRDKALAAGAAAYLQKPADNAQLLATIRAALGG